VGARPQDAASELRKALATSNDRCELLYLLWDCRFVLGDRAAAFETLLEAKGLAEGPMAARIAVAEASRFMSEGEHARAVRQRFHQGTHQSRGEPDVRALQCRATRTQRAHR
jgi:UTP:GlnB (protein PII) uridylyltransferase